MFPSIEEPTAEIKKDGPALTHKHNRRSAVFRLISPLSSISETICAPTGYPPIIPIKSATAQREGKRNHFREIGSRNRARSFPIRLYTARLERIIKGKREGIRTDPQLVSPKRIPFPTCCGKESKRIAHRKNRNSRTNRFTSFKLPPPS